MRLKPIPTISSPTTSKSPVIQALNHDVFVLAPPWSNCSNYTASIKHMMKQLAEDPRRHHELPPPAHWCACCHLPQSLRRLTRFLRQCLQTTRSGTRTFTSSETKRTGQLVWKGGGGHRGGWGGEGGQRVLHCHVGSTTRQHPRRPAAHEESQRLHWQAPPKACDRPSARRCAQGMHLPLPKCK